MREKPGRLNAWTGLKSDVSGFSSTRASAEAGDPTPRRGDYDSSASDFFLHNRPEFEPIRDDPAFQRLMEPR